MVRLREPVQNSDACSQPFDSVRNPTVSPGSLPAPYRLLALSRFCVPYFKISRHRRLSWSRVNSFPST